MPYDSRGLRFGEGIFETMKVEDDQVEFEQWHFERLQQGIGLLQLKGLPAMDLLALHCRELVKMNGHVKARVRLTVSGGAGSLFDDPAAQYTIESWEMQPAKEALGTCLFTGLPVEANMLSHIKHNNFLPYILAAKYAKQQGVDECITVNGQGNICEGTVSNIFLVKGNLLITPPLSEGCVGGIIRRHIVEQTPPGFSVVQKPVTLPMLEDADEVFLTNSVYGIRPVARFHDRSFPITVIDSIKKASGL